MDLDPGMSLRKSRNIYAWRNPLHGPVERLIKHSQIAEEAMYADDLGSPV